MAAAYINTFVGKCPAKYKDALFLTPKDIKNIMGIGETKVYEYLQDAPFRVERIGKLYRVHSRSFWNWYDIENEG